MLNGQPKAYRIAKYRYIFSLLVILAGVGWGGGVWGRGTNAWFWSSFLEILDDLSPNQYWLYKDLNSFFGWTQVNESTVLI